MIKKITRKSSQPSSHQNWNSPMVPKKENFLNTNFAEFIHFILDWVKERETIFKKLTLYLSMLAWMS